MTKKSSTGLPEDIGGYICIGRNYIRPKQQEFFSLRIKGGAVSNGVQHLKINIVLICSRHETINLRKGEHKQCVKLTVNYILQKHIALYA